MQVVELWGYSKITILRINTVCLVHKKLSKKQTTAYGLTWDRGVLFSSEGTLSRNFHVNIQNIYCAVKLLLLSSWLRLMKLVLFKGRKNATCYDTFHQWISAKLIANGINIENKENSMILHLYCYIKTHIGWTNLQPFAQNNKHFTWSWTEPTWKCRMKITIKLGIL